MRKQRYFNVSYIYNNNIGMGYGNCNFTTSGIYPSRTFITNWINKENNNKGTCITNITELSKADFLNWIKVTNEQKD